MKRKLRVLFAAFEAVPFIKTGGLGDVAGSLPRALIAAGVNVRLIMPKFSAIPEKYKSRMKHVAEFNVPLGWRNLYCGLEKLTLDGLVCYFIDNEYYFKRERPYGYFDDGERVAFFSKAVTEALPHLDGFPCDVLHCNDWHTALSPVFLREFYRDLPLYSDVKTVFTVHNLKFQGVFSDFVLGDILGLESVPPAAEQLRFDEGAVNYMKGGLSYSDVLTTVSPSYADEIKSSFFGEGLEGVFRRRENVLHGILNGIDTAEYDPSADSLIEKTYSAADLSGKAADKAALQRELGLEEDPAAPLIVMIGRLTEQKGLEILLRVLDELMEQPVQMAILGTGDEKYEKILKFDGWKYQGRLAVELKFDADLSHRMYAGADMLLMPSLFEPCGLSQMIAMGYGTLPVVRETGGLKDSVTPYNRYTGEGNGFSFANYNAHEMLFTLKDAIAIFRDEPETWRALVKSAMSADFGWERAAEEYKKIYESLRPDVAAGKKDK